MLLETKILLILQVTSAINPVAVAMKSPQPWETLSDVPFIMFPLLSKTGVIFWTYIVSF